MKAFDKKFGPQFISEIPTTPGVYHIFNASDELIYIGKAKNLRRRLGQYRNAKRRKRHKKMLQIITEASRIEWSVLASDLEACLTETRLIQHHRPKWNVEGAFYFLYPMIGLGYEQGELLLFYSTEPGKMSPELLQKLSLHGCYRSRFLSGNGFFSLMKLLNYIGHANRPKKYGKYSYLYSFRQLPEVWMNDLDLFFKGESIGALEKLTLALVENAAARRKPKAIQLLINDIKRFYRHEAALLNRVRSRLQLTVYPIPQKQRDLIFLQSRFALKQGPSSR